ncbi:hypothetical protein [Streptomyces scabiei]|uniref:hypothetical protein n=1 Tax=Streptomyces scabiei TaxID=1930 RepID=UPI0029A3A572|nr:hypothetical protein [Streptomyces scabiei]MDX2800104.1 hypothetical protein [Streptomyces scabiei]MDX3125393.1 hypothetical protein [Streptomyces scabiei]MDX3283219.1 hypothetical protein [Streptomyces scabiei]
MALALFTRRPKQHTPEAPALAVAQPEKPADNVLMRFLTQGGAQVHVTGSGSYVEDNNWKCLGCNDGSRGSGRHHWLAREAANAHASACRSMPQPNAA